MAAAAIGLTLAIGITGGAPASANQVWHQQVERASADAPCDMGVAEGDAAGWSEWSPSWAQWPNGGAGGWVCERSITWAKGAVPPCATSRGDLGATGETVSMIFAICAWSSCATPPADVVDAINASNPANDSASLPSETGYDLPTDQLITGIPATDAWIDVDIDWDCVGQETAPTIDGWVESVLGGPQVCTDNSAYGGLYPSCGDLSPVQQGGVATCTLGDGG